MTELFRTERMRVREWSPGDAPALYALSQDAGLNANAISDDRWKYRQSDEDAARRQIETWRDYTAQTGLGFWPIFSASSDELIGLTGIKPILPDGDPEPMWEIMYRFRESHWGRGLASELAPAIVEFGFRKRGLDAITGGILPDNLASKRVLEKAGLRYWRDIQILGVAAQLFRLRSAEFNANR